MKVFLLVFENLDPEDSGVLAMYSNMDAANEALLYAQSLNKYFKLRIDVSFADDKFFKTDFD